MTIILGIDPGSRITGYGVIKKEGRKLIYLGSGCIKAYSGNKEEDDFSLRLQTIFAGVSELILQFSPELFAIEQVFMGVNPGGALKLGQARGAAIVAATNKGLPVAEYSARQIKQSVVGNGAADWLRCQISGSLPKVGRINLGYFADSRGRIVTEVTIIRFGNDDFLLMTAAVAQWHDFEFLKKALPIGGSLILNDVTKSTAD